jgi:hypothetical protein
MEMHRSGILEKLDPHASDGLILYTIRKGLID